jgi:uncharacterized membrane protein YoaT (DUF817 family)
VAGGSALRALRFPDRGGAFALFAATALLYRRTRVFFRPFRKHRRMPLLLGFLLVALFIWFAENLGTFAHAWSYPHQRSGWAMVSIGKLGAWYLLMIISFVLVERLHGRREGTQTIAMRG